MLPRLEVGAAVVALDRAWGAWEVGDGASRWAWAVSGREKEEGVSASVVVRCWAVRGSCQLRWAGLGRKAGGGREGGKRAGRRENGPVGQN